MIIHSFGITLFALLPVNRLGTVDAMWPKPSESSVKTLARSLPKSPAIPKNANIHFIRVRKDSDTSLKLTHHYETSIQKAYLLNIGLDSAQQSVGPIIHLAQATPDDKPLAQSFPSTDRIWVKVRQAISLEEIARQLRIEAALLATLNLVESNHRFRQGEWIVVPAEERRAASQVVALDLRDVRRTPPAPQAPPMPTKGVVRLGDNLFKIAQRYGLTMQEILRLNPGLDTARLGACCA